MSILNFIKENRVLVAGLALPLLLVATLAITRMIPSAVTDPPQYKVIYYSQNWSGMGSFIPKVNEAGKIEISFNTNPQNSGTMGRQTPTIILYAYDPATQGVKNLTISYDSYMKPEITEKLSTIKLSSQFTSPDGYVFQEYRSRNYSLVAEIFGGSSYSNSPSLFKNGVYHDMPLPSPYYGTSMFLGWIIEGDVSW
jgi:hypothetical protein